MEEIFYPLLLTTLAGLSTIIGSVIAFIYKKPNQKFLSISLGFAAGVMIYVSMIEIFQKGLTSLSVELGDSLGMIIATISIFSGMFIIYIIDKAIPNPSEDDLMRMGVFSAIAIAIHNFPEGLATFISALYDKEMALPIFFAIAIHNIPEGIIVSLPIYYATKSRKKAFLYSVLSGLAEPVGALVGYFVFLRYITDNVYGIMFSIVAGIMVYISFNDLLPASTKHGGHESSFRGLIFGMIVMAISLCLFA